MIGWRRGSRGLVPAERSVRSTIWIVAVVVAGCHEVADPKFIVLEPTQPLSMIIADACMTDITQSCHGTPLIYGGLLYGTSVSYSSWPYDCPSGCTTYPLTYPQRTQIVRAIALIKPSCAWASAILGSINARQKIKSYNVEDANAADYHDDPFQPDFDEVHIYIEAFSGGGYGWSDSSLARLLVHEAWHAAYPITSTEDDANAAMLACV